MVDKYHLELSKVEYGFGGFLTTFMKLQASKDKCKPKPIRRKKRKKKKTVINKKYKRYQPTTDDYALINLKEKRADLSSNDNSIPNFVRWSMMHPFGGF